MLFSLHLFPTNLYLSFKIEIIQDLYSDLIQLGLQSLFSHPKYNIHISLTIYFIMHCFVNYLNSPSRPMSSLSVEISLFITCTNLCVCVCVCSVQFSHLVVSNSL